MSSGKKEKKEIPVSRSYQQRHRDWIDRSRVEVNKALQRDFFFFLS